MNHRRSPGGYHSLLTLGTLAALLLPACTPVASRAPDPPAPARPGPAWQAERTAVVAQINAARAGLGLQALAYDSLLERVGDAFCAILIEEGGDSHFSRSGVPPYLRYLLAGGNGFHRENVGSYSTTGTVTDAQVNSILLRTVEEMLAEVPPNDGHRRSLLDPWVTHIGVGVAVHGGEVRVTHELATEVTQSWTPPPAVAAPGTPLALSGQLLRPWQPEAVDVLWEEMPHPLSDAQTRGIRTYGYPKRRAIFYSNRSTPPGTTPPFTVNTLGTLGFRWFTAPHEGVEFALLLARRVSDGELVPVAASATVVLATGTLPPELAFWRGLGASPAQR
jgi:uncharacterized protein YkwD